MKIGIVWKNDYPWDIRIEKISAALYLAGNEVHLFCANTVKSRRNEVVDNIIIHRLPYSKNRFFNKITSTPFYFNPFWGGMLLRAQKKYQLELFIVRDLPLILIGLLLKKRAQIRLILDMAENYPAMYRQRINRGGFGTLYNWFIKNPYLANKIEKYACNNVDHIMVVVSEAKQRLVDMGIDENRISIVSNTPDINNFENINQLKGYDDFRIVYVGYIQEARGIDTVIMALKRLKNNGTDIKFTIVGTGDYLERLRNLSQELHVESMVEFTGWIENSNITHYINKCNAGVIPHKKNPHTDSTIPNKLFDFMACGKPVIVSDLIPVKRIVEEEKCGFVFESENIESFMTTLEKMVNARNRLAKMGANGRRAVESKYNWGYDQAILWDVINKC
ncbi:MAG: glycosyltransferase family 4 protein [Desulfobacteraceae bacterium]|nr:glycosyltransferase family 4 protein [Desulfobacteraceae bacterium]MBC2720925.1 glycosyltransferase family 4 protein [Desulfobacteraceae bacterium]